MSCDKCSLYLYLAFCQENSKCQRWTDFKQIKNKLGLNKPQNQMPVLLISSLVTFMVTCMIWNTLEHVLVVFAAFHK